MKILNLKKNDRNILESKEIIDKGPYSDHLRPQMEIAVNTPTKLDPSGSKINKEEQKLKSPLRCDLTSQFTPPKKRKAFNSDRFIPSQVRRLIDFKYFFEQNHETESQLQTESQNISPFTSRSDYNSMQEKRSQEVFKTLLKNELLGSEKQKNLNQTDDYNIDTSERIFFFSYKHSPQSQPSVFTSSPRIPYSVTNQQILRTNHENYRKISRLPFKNDYYLNLLDWSKNDVVSVALENKVYLWEFTSCKITNLMDFFDVDSAISCVKWCVDNPNIIAFSTIEGMLYLFDVKAQKCKFKSAMTPGQRIGCMDWNCSVLSFGSRDGIIRNYDVRSEEILLTNPEQGHNLEICGLKWDNSGKVLASGGNDNRIYLWNLNDPMPVQFINGHHGAVKALAWSPHEYGVLASGGGSADRCIKFWNTKSHQLMQSIDTQSQVCNIHWSLTDSELLSTHGFSSNAINVWSYPSMEKLASLKGHTSRVIYMSASPDGEKIVTGSADETLRFWNVFSKNNTLINNLDFDYLPHEKIR